MSLAQLFQSTPENPAQAYPCEILGEILKTCLGGLKVFMAARYFNFQGCATPIWVIWFVAALVYVIQPVFSVMEAEGDMTGKKLLKNISFIWTVVQSLCYYTVLGLTVHWLVQIKNNRSPYCNNWLYGSTAVWVIINLCLIAGTVIFGLCIIGTYCLATIMNRRARYRRHSETSLDPTNDNSM
eukprot:Platyproteum_vivax@DN782_c0_g1_i1.p1